VWPSYLDEAPPLCPHCRQPLVDISLPTYRVKTFGCPLDLVYLNIYPDGREEWAQQ